MARQVIWGPKDPDDVDNYVLDWAAEIVSPETISTSVFSLISGDAAAIDAQGNTASTSTVTISGGTNGQTIVLQCRITLSTGRQLDATVLLPVQDSGVPAIDTSDYNAPTPAQFVMFYPQFAAVSPVMIQFYLDQAGRQVDESWFVGDYANAIMLYAAHLMTVAGLGTDKAAILAAQGVSRFKSGTLEVAFQNTTSTTSADPLQATSFGQQFALLRLQNRGGPRAAREFSTVPVFTVGFIDQIVKWPT